MAALTAALIGLAGAGLYKSATQKGPDMPSPVAPPAAPVVDTAANDASARRSAQVVAARQVRTPGRASTLLTGPAGLNTPAPVAYKSLLGQ